MVGELPFRYSVQRVRARCSIGLTAWSATKLPYVRTNAMLGLLALMTLPERIRMIPYMISILTINNELRKSIGMFPPSG
ncbi:MAG: hypothetical protein K0S58_1528 [Nitrospira sp.]|nr:hypothetical protein [Nitrospira sp.]